MQEFVAASAAVVILGINQTNGEAAAGVFRDQGAAVDFFCVDVSNTKACQSAIHTLTSTRGRVDYLVNNAVSFMAKGLDATAADWERSLGVNLRGYADMVHACFEPIRQHGGAIVNMASVSAPVAQPNRWTYNASKGALVTLTTCQAFDIAPYHLRVYVVSPG